MASKLQPAASAKTRVVKQTPGGQITAADPDPTPKAKPVFGLILDFNGKEVVVDGSSFADIKKNGVDLGITEPVVLGTFDQLRVYLDSKFSVAIPDATNLPEPLKTVVNQVLNLEVTIVEAHLKVPGSDTVDQKKYYTFIMRVAKTDLSPMQFGSVSISVKGALLGVTNEEPKKVPEQ